MGLCLRHTWYATHVMPRHASIQRCCSMLCDVLCQRTAHIWPMQSSAPWSPTDSSVCTTRHRRLCCASRSVSSLSEHRQSSESCKVSSIRRIRHYLQSRSGTWYCKRSIIAVVFVKFYGTLACGRDPASGWLLRPDLQPSEPFFTKYLFANLMMFRRLCGAPWLSPGTYK